MMKLPGWRVVLLLIFAAPLAHADGPLRVAIFEADVTPPIGAALCNGGVRPVAEIADPLLCRGIVILGAGEPIVLAAVDWVGIGNAGHDVFRAALAEAAGTTPQRVTVHALHQHDAPGCDFDAEKLLAAHGLSGAMFDPDFARLAIRRCAEALGASLASATPLTHVGLGVGRVEKLASNRRVLGDDGKVRLVRTSSSKHPDAPTAPEGTIDPDLKLLTLWNAQEPLVALAYYATHPMSYYGKGQVSADLPGIARTLREKATGFRHIYFTGAGGNVTAGKYNTGDPANRPVLAQRLADAMAAAWAATVKHPLSPADIQWRIQGVSLPPATWMNEDQLTIELAAAEMPVRQRARAARNLAFLRRTRAGVPIELTCLALGPARILHMPGELFIEYQLAAQQMLPGRFVAMAAYGDYGPGYIGTTIAYTQGGYETGVVSRVAPEVESVLLPAMRKLLAD